MSVETRVHSFKGDREITFERVQDVEPILERNKALRSMPQKSDWGRHVATIPNVIIERWLMEEWARGNTGIRLGSEELKRLIARKIRDPEWAFLRTDR